MTGDDDTPDAPREEDRTKAARQTRLAEALRANLRKRKAQARARKRKQGRTSSSDERDDGET
jgi:hypothetical protein